MSVNSKLIPISYFSPKQSIRLNAYADTIIYEPDGRRQFLRAIRFGGYPEMVRALADALYAGADLEATIGAETYIFASEPKRYQRQFSHDGVYAEAVLLALDDELDSAQSEQELSQQALQQPPRRSFLFCPADDSQRLFEELDRKTDVPMIPAFKDYVLRTLEQRSILKRLPVLSIREKLDAWVLLRTKDDANIICAVEDGLKDGQIQIPGAATAPNGFERVSSVTDYLNAWKGIGVEIDAIYSGFLGDPVQVDIIKSLYERYPKALKLVDPVMADHGKIYPTYTPELCDAMVQLASEADILTPNLTEAAIILDQPIGDAWEGSDISDARAAELTAGLLEKGAKTVVLKGITRNDGIIRNFVAGQDFEPFCVENPYVPFMLHGTGDLYASALLAAIMAGRSMAEAADFAGSLTHDAMLVSSQQPDFQERGVSFETLLGRICDLLK